MREGQIIPYNNYPNSNPMRIRNFNKTQNKNLQFHKNNEKMASFDQ